MEKGLCWSGDQEADGHCFELHDHMDMGEIYRRHKELNTAKYRDNLNENLVLSIQNLS